jgi:molecular chaperone DnaK
VSQLVSKAVGIDLGTTNSAVAVLDPVDGDIVIHRDPVTRSMTTPSCVWRAPNSGEIVVGRKAFERKGGIPEPASSVKRLMGTRQTVDLSGQTHSPQQVSAFILAEMKRQIEADVSGFDGPWGRWNVDRAVITVPAYFDQPQIDATREAAELAGLEVHSLMHEPTAAATYHCWRTGIEQGTFLVYDLGGGTFDVSILRCVAGDFEVLGIGGNNRLGGDDIDTAFARWLQSMLQEDGRRLDLDVEHDQADRSRFARLKILAERAKKALSQSHEYMLRDDGTITDQDGAPVIVESMLERSDLEEIARPFIERTFGYCDDAVKQAGERAGIGLGDVDAVILAGGSTHMPLVRELVARELCGTAAPGSHRRERAKCAQPVYEEVDTVVALGAAVHAAATGGLRISEEPARPVRILLRGTGASSGTRLSTTGQVESLSSGLDLAGCRVELTTDEYQDSTGLTPDGSFGFQRIPLQRDGRTDLVFEVYDAAGAPLATATRPVRHGSRVIVEAERSTVNSKAIKLEVRRAGHAERRTLVPALEPLPYTRDFEFRHPGSVDAVELRLFQESRPIQVVRVHVDSDVPAGTPVLLRIVMHEDFAITVSGSIGEMDYAADVVLPEERGMPTEDEIEILRQRAEERIALLSQGRQLVQNVRVQQALQALREARGHGDAAAAMHERDQLESLVESFPVEKQLEPGKAVFDELVEDCGYQLARLQRHGVPSGRPFDARETAASIEQWRDLGERAFANRDQRRYTEAVTGLRNLHRHMKDIAMPSGPAPTPPTTAELAQSQIKANTNTIDQLRTQVRSLSDPDARRAAEEELADISAKNDSLAQRVSNNPGTAREEAGKLGARLTGLRNRLTQPARRGPRTDIPLDEGE